MNLNEFVGILFIVVYSLPSLLEGQGEVIGESYLLQRANSCYQFVGMLRCLLRNIHARMRSVGTA